MASTPEPRTDPVNFCECGAELKTDAQICYMCYISGCTQEMHDEAECIYMWNADVLSAKLDNECERINGGYYADRYNV